MPAPELVQLPQAVDAPGRARSRASAVVPLIVTSQNLVSVHAFERS